MDNNNENRNNEAESLFATRRKKQQEEEAEKARLEELERQKQQMAEEIARLEKMQSVQSTEIKDKPDRKKLITLGLGGVGAVLVIAVICIAISGIAGKNSTRSIVTETTASSVSAETTAQTTAQTTAAPEQTTPAETTAAEETSEEFTGEETRAMNVGDAANMFSDAEDYDNYGYEDDYSEYYTDDYYGEEQYSEESSFMEMVLNGEWYEGRDEYTGRTYSYPAIFEYDDDMGMYGYYDEQNNEYYSMSVDFWTDDSGHNYTTEDIVSLLGQEMGDEFGECDYSSIDYGDGTQCFFFKLYDFDGEGSNMLEATFFVIQDDCLMQMTFGYVAAADYNEYPILDDAYTLFRYIRGSMAVG